MNSDWIGCVRKEAERRGIEGAVFDQDGTLFDTEAIYHRTWYMVRDEYPMLRDIEEDVKACIGRGSADNERYMKGKYGPDFPYFAFWQKRLGYVERILDTEGLIVKPGAREVLELFRAAGIRMALATSTQAHLTQKQLGMSGFASYFSAVGTGDRVTRGKPDPQIYLLACRDLGADPAHVIGFEDSDSGATALIRASIAAVVVPDQFEPSPFVRQNAWAVLPGLDEFPAFLAREWETETETEKNKRKREGTICC